MQPEAMMQLGRSFFEGVVVSISPLRKLLHNPWQHQRYYVASFFKDLHDFNQSLSVVAGRGRRFPFASTTAGGDPAQPGALLWRIVEGPNRTGRPLPLLEHSEVPPPALTEQLTTTAQSFQLGLRARDQKKAHRPLTIAVFDGVPYSMDLAQVRRRGSTNDVDRPRP
jgi:hypothetical protein